MRFIFSYSWSWRRKVNCRKKNKMSLFSKNRENNLKLGINKKGNEEKNIEEREKGGTFTN